MSGHKTTSLLAGGAGLAVAIASFQTWVKWSGDWGVLTLSGTGEFSSPYALIAGQVASWYAFPIGWITAVLGVVVIGSAVLHHMEILDDDVALKAVVLPSALGAVAAAVVLVDKNLLLTGVPKGGLDGATPSAGIGAIVVLLAFLVAMASGFALSGTSRPRYVRRSSTVRSRSTAGPTRGKATTRPATKKATKKKKSKKKKAAAGSTPLPQKGIGHDASVADVDEVARVAEEHQLTQPRVEYRGGSQGQPPVWLTHWCARLPPVLRATLGVPGVPEAGPVLLLHAGGGVAEQDLIPAMVRAEKPQLLNDLQYVSWEASLAPLFTEIGRRYTVLELVRDDAWLTPLLESAGITTRQTCAEPVQGEYDIYQRELVTIEVPVLIGAEVRENGLVLRFRSQVGDPADTWVRGLTVLREGFSTAGMNAVHLRVADGPEGGIELRFNDKREAVEENYGS
ncbi:FtsK/SpoIIIE family protein [Mycobacteroides abscessus subsp. abscessus]|uniref:hypothetical protein n=1 Tax=Mycobacteroides abscessus TaxID=36809 RepID=UPI0009A7B93F|nr:hypothetical protein [Mycobacteroides abscessus]MBN7388571.1 hypothetical protein [Mycobacteroides abscessus subsp. abscessus]MBN7414841.1 hypothetical protein [Mycobacteroides abscessus subsp. abscessus]MDO2961006.1 hypothetical protein [Mycobacteroides abscessus subsp. abscessus]MDO2994974.1 hypothetical protein [Mycobacteroides abscessus subsp. abscessus]MDO3064374.1 hypothetical protein [Mycobacteroides abscessus subsp. abscessus]